MGFIDFLKANWYWFAGALLIVFIIALIVKRKKGPEYHDQIKENKRLFTKELEINRTETKWLVYKDRIFKVKGERWLGRKEVYTTKPNQRMDKEYTEMDLKQLQFEQLKAKLKSYADPEILAWKFLCKTKYLDLKLFRIYFGEEEIIYLGPDDFHRFSVSACRINDRVRLMYEKGVFIPMRIDMIDVVSEETERVMKDLEINARGKQQKDFSRLDKEFAHQEVTQDKAIEAEKEKKKAISYG
jgi:hypothetical protein